MSELFHECGVAAIYHLPTGEISRLLPAENINTASGLIVRMLQDMQNRGQLSAGLTRFHATPENGQLLDTYRELGTVQEVFRLSHEAKAASLMTRYLGPAAIGHVRYATCGKTDRSYAQPFENHDFHKRRWFSFAFNGQLANYPHLERELLQEDNHHLVRSTDTEILLNEITKVMNRDPLIPLNSMMQMISQRLDGAYSIALLNAAGEMLVARDPLGIKPMCYAQQGNLFAAASESVALLNLGFKRDEIHSLPPGHSITISGGEVKLQPFALNQSSAHCFFEWIYFANVASTLDGRSVYLTRKALGVELARLERENPLMNIDEDTIVVPVPDTSKAAADSMAFELGIPSMEGLMRNRYSGRTFIENTQESRRARAKTKYTPLHEILHNKKVILVEDSIVRSTTMHALLQRLREEGGVREIHVRVACPPIVAPCFYGIDMSTVRQLFAPKFMKDPNDLTAEVQAEMAEKLGADSLRYLPVSSIASALEMKGSQLCQACITGEYPTPAGQELYQLDLACGSEECDSNEDRRAFDSLGAPTT
ncbi:MAG: amidophosphoribosyltransferase [Pirellulaceae bacterium]